MKKHILVCLGLIFMTGVVALGQSVGQTTEKQDPLYPAYDVVADVLSVRAEPSVDGRIVGELKSKQVVSVLEMKDGWASIIAKDDSGRSLSGYVESEYIASHGLSVFKEHLKRFWFVYSIIGFFLICYIISLVKTGRGEMIVFVNWFDFALLFSPVIFGVLALIIFLIVEKAMGVMLSDTARLIGLYVYIGVSGIGSLCSLVWSVIANKGNIFRFKIT